MSEEPSPEQKKAIEELTQAVAKDLAGGKKKADVATALVKSGWTQDDASAFVDNVDRALQEYRASPEGRAVLASKYARHMVYGVLWAVGGTAVTVISYSSAASSPRGGTYVIAWGAIVFGVIDFFIGLFGWLRNRG
ncbi:MAG: hypothetical protein HY720_20040 [Planctomycetes bacterium]|nr:hypothetical protein [Planctomycetota bacterium]